MNTKIIRLFQQKQLSKYEIAWRSGVPYTTVNEILNAKTDVNRCAAETVCRLAAVLQVKPEEVLNDIHILDGACGKHMGVRFTLCFNGECMEIRFKYNEEDVVLETGQQYRIPERRDDYLTFVKWRIEEYLENRAFEDYAQKHFAETV